MKIKTLLVGFVLITMLGISSCKKKNDYTQLYTGDYKVTITQNLTVVAPIYGEIPLQEEYIYGTAQIVKDENEGDSNVKILMSFSEGGIYYLDAYCDQTNMQIKNKKVNITHSISNYNNVRFEYTLEGGTAAPQNISWTSSVSGKCTTHVGESLQKTYNVDVTLKFMFSPLNEN